MTNIKKFIRETIEPIERTVSLITGEEKQSAIIHTIQAPSGSNFDNIATDQVLHVGTQIKLNSIKLQV